MSSDGVCTRCGHRNQGQPTFCASCGSFLEWSAPDAAELDPAPSTSSLAQSSSERLQRGRELGELGGRADLAAQLERANDRVARPAVPIAVVGQYKVGKSRFVNAVVNAGVCPSDAIVGSMVPTIVRHGDQQRAMVEMLDGRSSEIALPEVEQWVSEVHNAGNHKGVAEVSVHLPRQFLSAGLALIDTPGLGGLDSPAGRLLSRTVEAAAGMLLLSAAVQELTQPELAFLERVRNADLDVALVVTKTDLTPHWRRIVEINRGHLSDAGLEMPVFALSAPLRQVAAERGDSVINDESGFPAVLRWLHEVGSARADHEARRADRLLRDATAQLRSAARVAERVIETPERAAPVLRHLELVSEAATSFADPDASWRVTLDRECEATARWRRQIAEERFGSLVERADDLLAASPDVDFWGEFEAWVRQSATDTSLGVVDELVERYQRIATTVSAEIDAPIETRDIEQFPSVGSLGAALMVGPLGAGLISPLDAPEGLPSAEGEAGRLLVRQAVERQLTSFGADLDQLLSAEDERFQALISMHVEAQGAQLANSVEATRAMAVAASPANSSTGDNGAAQEPGDGRPRLTLSSLRAQLDGLDELDAELSGDAA